MISDELEHIVYHARRVANQFANRAREAAVFDDPSCLQMSPEDAKAAGDLIEVLVQTTRNLARQVDLEQAKAEEYRNTMLGGIALVTHLRQESFWTLLAWWRKNRVRQC